MFAFLGQTKHEAGVERETRPTVEGAENFSLCLPCRVCLAIFTSFARAFARLNNAKNKRRPVLQAAFNLRVTLTQAFRLTARAFLAHGKIRAVL